MIPQTTLKNTIRATGIGLHTGATVVVALKPAAVDHGIVFTRADLAPAVSVAARAENVGDTRLATTLAAGDVRVGAVEHLMSAFFGLGIDNAEVELDGPEMPVMDGSAAPFVFLIQSAGIVEQTSPRRYIRILKETTHRDGESVASLEPYDGCRIEYTDDAQRQHALVDLTATAYVREVSRARTFGFLADVEQLEAMDVSAESLLDSASLSAEVARADANPRLDDEFARHKILDAMGDLYLLGHSVLGHYRGHASDHRCNNVLVRSVLADPDGFEIVTLDADAAISPGGHPDSVHG